MMSSSRSLVCHKIDAVRYGIVGMEVPFTVRNCHRMTTDLA